jgi:hypothetical protein
MKIRRVAAALVFLGFWLALAIGSARSGNQLIKQYILFNGSQPADSTPQASYWIPVRGASRVVIRMFNANTGAWATDDSATTDSITAFTAQMGDSLSFIGKDSLGTLVPAYSMARGGDPYQWSWTVNTAGVPYNTFPIIVDSTVVTGDGADSTKWFSVYHSPVTSGATSRSLNFTNTKGGWYTFIYPISPAPAGLIGGITPTRFTASQSGSDVFSTSFLRIRVTPFTRSTKAGVASTQGIRTTGLNKLRATAYVYFNNQ